MPAPSPADGRPGDPDDPDGTPRLIARFLEWMRVRAYSPCTIRNRRMSLHRFLRWCEERELHRPADVTRPILEQYQKTLFYTRQKDGKPLSIMTQLFLLEPVKALFKWLVKSNLLLSNPAADLELPRLGKRLPKHIFTASDADQVINEPDIKEPLGIRDRAILETLYSSGIRRAEVCALRIEHIDFDRGTVTIREGKGRKDRVVPIGARALAWIAKYLADARPRLLGSAEESGVLFLTVKGGPLAPATLSALAKGYREAAGVSKKGACHVFRHTMATLMLENGADLRALQEMLGHARLETTERYTHVAIRRLKEIHEKTHPAATKEEKDGGPSERDRSGPAEPEPSR